MKILLTNHHLIDYGGTETFTYVLADFLKRGCHEVSVYSKYVHKMAPLFEGIDVPIYQDLKSIKHEPFDIVHVHHNLNALEVRYYFPDLPMVFLSHGVIPFLEHPPPINLDVSLFLAVSEEVRDHLRVVGIRDSTIEIVRNPVDPERFVSKKVINETPRAALVLSNRITTEIEETIRGACASLGIECRFLGRRFGGVDPLSVPDEINKADIVFTLGRGVIETMMCGRIPIVLDYLGGDGMVTPLNFRELMWHNFSGRRYGIRYETKTLEKEIQRYVADSGLVLRCLAKEYFDANHITAKLLGIYERSISGQQNADDLVDSLELLSFMVSAMAETGTYANQHALVSYKDAILEDVYSGVSGKALRWYRRFSKTVFPQGSRRRRLIGAIKGRPARVRSG